MQVLEKIQQAETEQKQKTDPYRTAFHLMPPVGWLNDPNGLCHFRDEYHVFFQYSPFHPEGGMKCWGHYTSKDLLHWQYQGVTFLPDTKWDKDGAYSGSCYTDGEKMYLYYTGNVKEDGNHDYITSGRQSNTLYVESEDGRHFTEKECVLNQYPAGYSCHIRDPKVWKQDGRYYMILGARTAEDAGAVLLYQSDDKKHWELYKEFTSQKTFGYMWECPDSFMLDGKEILAVCPQGVERQELKYQNIYLSGYFLLDHGFEVRGDERLFREWDMGFDFYAPQTFEDEKGRRLLIGWAGLPDIEKEYTNASVAYGWQHCLTSIRQLSVNNGIVSQYPVAEYNELRSREVKFENGNAEEIQAAFDFVCEGITTSEFMITISDEISLKYENGVLSLAFTGTSGCGRHIRRAEVARIHDLRILADTSIMEIFINHGEIVMTTRYYMESAKRSIYTENLDGQITVWEMTGYQYR